MNQQPKVFVHWRDTDLDEPSCFRCLNIRMCHLAPARHERPPAEARDLHEFAIGIAAVYAKACVEYRQDGALMKTD